MFKVGPATGMYIRNSDLNRRRLMHRAKTKSLRISVVIVAAFLIWWTPYYTMMIIFLFLDPDEHVSIDLPYTRRKYIILFCLSSRRITIDKLTNRRCFQLSEELQSGIFFFGMSNSLVNPLIYGAFHLWPQKQRQGSYQRWIKFTRPFDVPRIAFSFSLFHPCVLLQYIDILMNVSQCNENLYFITIKCRVRQQCTNFDYNNYLINKKQILLFIHTSYL